MKRAWAILLSLFLLVAKGAAAEKADSNVNALDLNSSSSSGVFESIASLCWAENTLYVLGERGVYRWAAGDAQPSVYLDLSESSKFRYMEQPPNGPEDAAAWSLAISRLFSDGPALYGLQPYSGQVFLLMEDGARPFAQIPANLLASKDASFHREIKSAALASDKIFLLLGTDDYNDYEKTELIAYDIAAQTAAACSPMGVQSFARGADGKLVLFTQGDEHALWQYDIATDAVDVKLTALKPDENPGGLAWCSQRQAAAYCLDNRVILTDVNGESQLKAYLPVLYASADGSAACSQEGIYAFPYGNYIFLRNVNSEDEASQTVLTLLGNIPPNLMIDFSIANPDIAVISSRSSTSDYMKQAAISADESADLFVLSAPGDFAAMKKKGFVDSLNDETGLVESARELYPTIQDTVFSGDALLAYPIAIKPQSWTVNETRWMEFGLPDYPRTYDELYNTIALWLKRYAEDNMEFTLSDIQQSNLEMLMTMLVKEYIFQHEVSEERFSFDTPAFRALLTGVSENAHLLSEDNEQWGMPLISSYYQGFGVSYNDDDLVRMILPPTLDVGQTQMLNASLEVICVNASSAQKDAAKRFVAFCAKNLDASTRYALNPRLNEPVRFAHYDDRVKALKAELALLHTRLEMADESQTAVLQDEIVQKELTLESVMSNEWSISQESIEVYRDVAKNMRVPYDSVFLSEGENGGFEAISTVIRQYCADGLDEGEADALIKDLDRITYMVYMEGL